MLSGLFFAAERLKSERNFDKKDISILLELGLKARN